MFLLVFLVLLLGLSLGNRLNELLEYYQFLWCHKPQNLFGNWGSNFKVALGKIVTLTSIVSSSGYRIKSVSTLSFCWINWVIYSKKHCWRFALFSIFSQSATDGNSSTSFQLIAFNSLCNNSFSEGTCLSKYWQELNNIKTNKRENCFNFLFLNWDTNL